MRDGSGLNLELLAQVAEALLRLQLVAALEVLFLAGLRMVTTTAPSPPASRPSGWRWGATRPPPRAIFDVSKRLHLSLYALYRRRGDQLDWDGQRLLGLQGASVR